MESSKLVGLLKTFEDEEWKAFHLFLKSPYHNRRKKLVELYELLYKISATWSSKKLVKTAIYAKLYPNETFVERRLVEMRNALVKLIEQFWELNDQDSAYVSYAKIALAYHKKHLANYRDISFEKSLKSLQNDRLEVSKYHKHLFDYHLTQHNLIEAEEQRNQEPNLQALHDHLDTFYLCSKLKYFCSVLNYQNFRSHQYDIAMMDLVLEEAAKKKYTQYPSIQIYYNGVFTLLSLDNASHFYALKTLLDQQTKSFSTEELQNIFTIARNFCIKNLRRGKRAYMKEAFDLYKIEIEKNLIIQDGKIPDASCRNLIKFALLLGETEWANNFLTEYKSKIAKDVFTLSLANVHFHQNKYVEVLDLLVNLDFKEVLLALAARALILKTYFQLCRTTNDFAYEDKLEAYIESFNAFLKRKKEVLTKGYLLYLNLIKFTHAINKLYWLPSLNKAKLAEIHQKILETPKTAEWEWLKEISKV